MKKIFFLIVLLPFFGCDDFVENEDILTGTKRDAPSCSEVSEDFQGQCEVDIFPLRNNLNEDHENIMSIQEIKQNELPSGKYKTEGFVVKQYTCPPCPKGAYCKTCMKNNIVISQNQKLINNYNDVGTQQLILFTKTPNDYLLSAKYQFEIFITDQNSTGGTLNDTEIIQAKHLMSAVQ